MPDDASLVHSRRHALLAAIRTTLPLALSALPFGMVFGALAVNNGFTSWTTLLMSMTVLAGASQIAAVGLLAEGSGLAVVLFATFVINMRHILYAASLGVHLKGVAQRMLLPLGFLLTDQTYAVSIAYFQGHEARYKPWYMLGSGITMFIAWTGGTFVGVVLGTQIPDVSNWGLSFAIVVVFIALVVPHITSHPMVIAVLTSGVVSILAADLPNNLGLVAAALSGILVGLLADTLSPTAPKTSMSAESHPQ